jgi:retron-type reverse transcriptase
MTSVNKLDDTWKNLPWKKFRKVVFRLQCRIFAAQRNGNKALVIKLQKLLLSSKAAKWLAIRQVTQLNTGKKTSGIDGKTALRVRERVTLFETLNKHWKNWRHKPLKRVFIPKVDGSRRGLGIPTIADRAYQGLLKLALIKRKPPRKDEITALNGFRYADDVVYILKPEDDERELRILIDKFLAERGLKVKEAKTNTISQK